MEIKKRDDIFLFFSLVLIFVLCYNLTRKKGNNFVDLVKDEIMIKQLRGGTNVREHNFAGLIGSR